MYKYKGIITKIVDGDSFDIEVDLGFYVKVRAKFRLAGYQAPEMKKKTLEMGRIAKAKLEELIPVGSEVVFNSEKMGKWKRWIAHVHWKDTTLSKYLIELGYGQYWDGKDSANKPVFDPTQPYPLKEEE